RLPVHLADRGGQHPGPAARRPRPARPRHGHLDDGAAWQLPGERPAHRGGVRGQPASRVLAVRRGHGDRGPGDLDRPRCPARAAAASFRASLTDAGHRRTLTDAGDPRTWTDAGDPRTLTDAGGHGTLPDAENLRTWTDADDPRTLDETRSGHGT